MMLFKLKEKCINRGAVAWFESLTSIRSPKCLVDPGYIIEKTERVKERERKRERERDTEREGKQKE